MRTSMNAICYMTKSRPKSIQELESHTNLVFSKIDSNKDGFISLAEFQSFITKDIDVMKLLAQLGLTTTEDIRVNWGSDETPDVDSDLENEANRDMKRGAIEERVKAGVEELDDQIFMLESAGVGDNFMAVRPYEGVVRNSVPSGYRPRKGEDDPPDANLELEYIHGYRCHDVRNNVRYTSSGEIVYHTAAVGIVLNSGVNAQKHFLCHTDDIIAFDVNSRGTLAATGEIGRTPLLCV